MEFNSVEVRWAGWMIIAWFVLLLIWPGSRD